MKKSILLIGFILMAGLQWVVPLRMIFAKEKILLSGKEFRFRTEPFDPYDAFRGKYIHLAFRQTSVRIQDSSDWIQGDMIYGLLAEDSSGFAQIITVTKEEPAKDVDYLKLMAGYVYMDSVTTISINYPFDRFYMEESKASAADAAYNEAMRDTSQVAYALVRIHEGEAVIQDVFIDGIPIKQVAKQRQQEEEKINQ